MRKQEEGLHLYHNFCLFSLDLLSISSLLIFNEQISWSMILNNASSWRWSVSSYHQVSGLWSKLQSFSLPVLIWNAKFNRIMFVYSPSPIKMIIQNAGKLFSSLSKTVQWHLCTSLKYSRDPETFKWVSRTSWSGQRCMENFDASHDQKLRDQVNKQSFYVLAKQSNDVIHYWSPNTFKSLSINNQLHKLE